MKFIKLITMVSLILLSGFGLAMAGDLDDGISKFTDDGMSSYDDLGKEAKNIKFIIMNSKSQALHVGIGARAMSQLALGQYSDALVLLGEATQNIINDTAIDGGFKALAQISANVLADPELEQTEFRETRSQLTFRD